jgi:NADPH-dependent 2,4-dienoyl-CoA reductase/sulfur reductase-like enzyme
VTTYRTDVLVIGAGAAGLAAATAAAGDGRKTILIERDSYPGGVLEQCIHPGFGVHRYGEDLTGPEFAARLMSEFESGRAKLLTETSVLSIDPATRAVVTVGPQGIRTIRAKAIVLATGARERPFGALRIPGSRPAGILTAGLAQKLVNLYNLLPGHRALILGSGDIGLIMARRLHLEGVEVVGVLELKSFPGGLTRNVVQCLDDYNIPLYLSRTVIGVHGRERLTGVTTAMVDEAGHVVAGSEREFHVDTLILSVGLIPETDLVSQFVALDRINGGPVVDSTWCTEAPWLFAAGNSVVVFDLVDTVAAAGEGAGKFAAQFVNGDNNGVRKTPLIRGNNVLHLVPTMIAPSAPTMIHLRVPRPMERVWVNIGGGIVSHRFVGVRPAEMIEVKIPLEAAKELGNLPEAKVEVIEG